jgi:DNA-binding protein H-NS
VDIDLAQLSVNELSNLRKRLERDLKSRVTQERRVAQKEQEEKRRAAIKQIHELAGTYSLSLEEVMARRGRGQRSDDEGEGEIVGPKSSPKYRNPFNMEQTWTGRGRKPGWIVSLLQQGRTLEELAA